MINVACLEKISSRITFKSRQEAIYLIRCSARINTKPNFISVLLTLLSRFFNCKQTVGSIVGIRFLPAQLKCCLKMHLESVIICNFFMCDHIFETFFIYLKQPLAPPSLSLSYHSILWLNSYSSYYRKYLIFFTFFSHQQCLSPWLIIITFIYFTTIFFFDIIATSFAFLHLYIYTVSLFCVLTLIP